LIDFLNLSISSWVFLLNWLLFNHWFCERVRLWHLRLFLRVFLNRRRLSGAVAGITLLHTVANIHSGALASLSNSDSTGPSEGFDDIDSV